MHKDAKLIDKLGGDTRLAERLGFEKSGPQRVHNWRTRGIPADVKLAHPELFLRDLVIERDRVPA